MIEEDDDNEDEDESLNEQHKTEGSAAQCSENELNAYRKQLENEVSFAETKPTATAKKTDDSIRRYIESCTQYLGNVSLAAEETELNADQALPQPISVEAKATEIHIPVVNKTESQTSNSLPTEETKIIADDAHSISSNDLETDDLNDLVDIDPNSRMYRLKMVEKMLSDARSQRSYSTTTSTIAPSVITDRIKRNMDVREKKEMRKRSVAKGEASAVQRGRKENKSVVQEYAGWDYWAVDFINFYNFK